MVFTMNEVEKLKVLKRRFVGRVIRSAERDSDCIVINKANIEDIHFDMDSESIVVLSNCEQFNPILELDCSARGKMIALEELERRLDAFNAPRIVEHDGIKSVGWTFNKSSDELEKMLKERP